MSKTSQKAGRETEVRPFRPLELVKIFEHVPDRCRALYATLLFTGARLAELVPSPRSTHKPLLKSEIDFENGCIHLRQAKGRSGRRPLCRPPIPVPEDVLCLLKKQMVRTPPAYPFAFMILQNAARDFNSILKRAGIPKTDAADRKLILHSFRHTYASFMATQVQNNPHFLKSLLGHSRIATTVRHCQIEATILPLTKISLPLAETGKGHHEVPKTDCSAVPEQKGSQES